MSDLMLRRTENEDGNTFL
jgi:hypothetical protein